MRCGDGTKISHLVMLTYYLPLISTNRVIFVFSASLSLFGILSQLMRTSHRRSKKSSTAALLQKLKI